MSLHGQKGVYVAVLGVGGVGKAFLSQLEALTHRYAQNNGPKVHLCGIGSSKKFLYGKDYSLQYDGILKQLEECHTEAPTVEKLITWITNSPGRNVLVDNTSSQELANSYPELLKRHIYIVTPNKKAFSGDYQLWQKIQDALAASGAKVFHESSVGAGLPVISTLKDLVETGDEVTKIEGVFSGTMSFLFNSFAPTEGSGGKWSTEVKKAKDLGYTEPDPRDDLNGLDVARKLTILARMVGLKVQTPTSFPVQSLIPKELEHVASAAEFMDKLPQFDAQMEEIKQAAEKEGKVVRFVGSINVPTNTVKVGLEKFDRAHPIAALKGSDNIISFTTKRYQSPLIVQGAGAGGDVTAAGVTGDLIRAIHDNGS